MWRNLGISFLSWDILDNVLFSRKQSSFFWIICLIWSSPKTDPEKKFLNLVFLNRNYLNKYLSSLHLLTYFISLIQSRLRSSFVLLFEWVIGIIVFFFFYVRNVFTTTSYQRFDIFSVVHRGITFAYVVWIYTTLPSVIWG